MAIAIMTRAWRESPQKGPTLLLLLALADMANEETGECWPSVKLLALRCRQKVRNTQYCLRKLEKSGEIKALRRAALRKTTMYTVMYMGAKFAPGGRVTPLAPGGCKPLHPEPKGNRNKELNSLLENPPAVAQIGKARVYTRFGVPVKLLAFDPEERVARGYIFDRRVEKEFAARDLFWHRPPKLNGDVRPTARNT